MTVITAFGQAFAGSISVAMATPCGYPFWYPGVSRPWVRCECPLREGHDGSHCDNSFASIPQEDIDFFQRQYELCTK